jgi:DNA-binding NarL/FixJ family response regulator
MKDSVSIYLVDDHKIVRDGIKSLLIGNKCIRVAGEANNGKELLSLLERELPDIVVLDLALPDIHGIELTKTITEQYPSVKILILTAEINENVILETIKNGACGFLNKDISSDEFIDALLLVSDGECYFGQRVSGIIYKSYIKKVQNPLGNELTKSLSEREKEIICLLSEGLSFKETGDKLCLSPRTVENHKTRILEKLDLKNTIELVKYAIKHELISL